MLSEVFWISLTTGVLAFAGVVCRMAYKSKCSHIKLCGGCIEVDRNTEGELKEDKYEVNHTDSRSDTTMEEPKVPPPSPESGKFLEINPMKMGRLFAP
jgi:hypothetical protein